MPMSRPVSPSKTKPVIRMRKRKTAWSAVASSKPKPTRGMIQGAKMIMTTVTAMRMMQMTLPTFTERFQASLRRPVARRKVKSGTKVAVRAPATIRVSR